MSRLRAAARRDDGFTLVELLVATALGVTLLLATANVIESATRAQGRVDDRTDSIQRGRTALEQIVQQVRSQVCLGPGYPALEYGDPNRAVFYADLANSTFVPERRELTYADGAITERAWRGVASSGSGAPFTFSDPPYRVRVIADRLAPLALDGTALPVFTYYAFDGADPIRPSRVLATPLDATTPDRAKVVQMRVAFTALPAGRASRADGEPFSANVYVRTADPTDPDHSPLCI